MKPLLYNYLFLLVSIFSTVQAQQNQVYFEKHDVIAGLPESSVRDMVEDDLGYIWMATQNGLVRYDGYNYKVYHLGTKKTNSNPISNVNSIFIGQGKALWISTSENGLFKYNREKDSFTQFRYPENLNPGYCIIRTQDKEGNLWGTAALNQEASYLWKFDTKGNFEHFGKQFKKDNHIDATDINSIFTSQSGKIWIGTDNGFYCYQGKNKHLKGFSTATDLTKKLNIGFIYEAPSEKEVLWMVNIMENKIFRFDVKTETITTFQPQSYSFDFPAIEPDFIAAMNERTINTIYEDKNKQLWFSGFDGIVRLNRKTATFDYFKTGFGDEETNPQKWLFDIKENKNGDFWLTSLGGLVHFNTKTATFERYLADASRSGAVLSSNVVMKKMLDHTGTLWLGYMWAGANKSNGKKSSFSVYKYNPKVADGYPEEGVSVAAGTNGHLWFSNKNFIYNWQPSTNRFTKKFEVDQGETFERRGYITKEGNLYIATNKNLVFYNLTTGKKEKYPTDRIVQDGYLTIPTEDKNGIIWLRTVRDKGIVSFDPKAKKFKHYPYRQNSEKVTKQNEGALDDDRVLTMYVDQQNNFWVGTNQGGLNLYDAANDEFISYFDKDDKLVSCITGMFEDSSGRFWVGTYQSGLFEFDRKKGKWTRHLDESNGLLCNSVFGISEDAKGMIWMRTERGISRMNPKDLSVTNFPSNTILTDENFGRNGRDLFKLETGKFMIENEDAIILFDPKDLDANPFPPKVQLENIAVINPDAKTAAFETILTFGKKELELTYEQNRVRFNYVGLHYDDPTANKYAYKLDGYDKEWVQAGTERSVTYTNLSPGTYVFNVKAANSDGVWSTENPSITIVISPPWWKTWWAYFIYFILFISVLRAYVVFRARALKRENTILEEKVTHRTSQLTKSIDDLKNTQSQLIQSEKMASLGELTAGIAHEIQNPLNFVNNFSEVSNEMILEIKEERAKNKEDRDEALQDEILEDISKNLEKINHHGKRADAIVKGMLQHSRSSSGIKEPTDINKLADEYLRLAYHGLRAKDKSFNARLITDYDETIGNINIIPQDMGRVILNLITNAFHATNEKKKQIGEDYEPTVSVSTKKAAHAIEVSVKDNGNGIPKTALDKIFQPFFTTKPTGQGTGLGLSLSYDIVKAHGGELKVETKENEGSEFIIVLPIN
jgi:signal transduction histidine kinase/ligand-binding sensor domain-containing protein